MCKKTYDAIQQNQDFTTNTKLTNNKFEMIHPMQFQITKFEWLFDFHCTTLSIHFSDQHKIRKSSICCLKKRQKKWINYEFIWVLNHLFSNGRQELSHKNEFTFLKTSRVHKRLPNPWIFTGCCVFAMNIKYNCCISIEYKYQSDWHNSS